MFWGGGVPGDAQEKDGCGGRLAHSTVQYMPALLCTNKGKHDEGCTFTDKYRSLAPGTWHLADLVASTGGKVLPPAR